MKHEPCPYTDFFGLQLPCNAFEYLYRKDPDWSLFDFFFFVFSRNGDSKKPQACGERLEVARSIHFEGPERMPADSYGLPNQLCIYNEKKKDRRRKSWWSILSFYRFASRFTNFSSSLESLKCLSDRDVSRQWKCTSKGELLRPCVFFWAF